MILFIVEPAQGSIIKEIDLLAIIEEEYDYCLPLGFSYLNDVS